MANPFFGEEDVDLSTIYGEITSKIPMKSDKKPVVLDQAELEDAMIPLYAGRYQKLVAEDENEALEKFQILACQEGLM
ncbi:hypothetical protein N7490_007658 [Penicillium lividum]|nr:hypothetical protein N7490_007658 [Penicillium lividum]